MPLEISSWAIAEKNKVSQGNCWLLLLEFNIPSETQPVRLVRNREDVVFGGYTWQAFNFDINEISESSKGEVPRIDISVSNVDNVMDWYVDRYKVWIQTHSYEPIVVKIMLINSGNLSASSPEALYIFELDQPKTDNHNVVFTIVGPNLYRRRYPQTRILSNQCQHETRYGGIECGRAADTTYPDCDYTLDACKARGNAGRFGGFPGAGSDAVRV
jgi:phage-related protein